MTPDPLAVEQAGDPRHPDHARYICELGRAAYECARVAGIAFDILRVFDHVPSDVMYDDPLGMLLARLRGLASRQPELPGLSEFIVQLEEGVRTRNDLIHALPVKDGLHRRRSKDGDYVRNFYTVDDLRAVAEELEAVQRAGNTLLHQDDGAAVRAWYAAGGGA